MTDYSTETGIVYAGVCARYLVCRGCEIPLLMQSKVLNMRVLSLGYQVCRRNAISDPSPRIKTENRRDDRVVARF